MLSVNTSRALTPADDSPPVSVTLHFTQNGVTVDAVLTLAINPAAVQPVPVSVSLNPPSQTLPDNTPAGIPVTTPNIVMSDGSQFAGTMTVDPPTTPLVLAIT
jgi:hypothetical protein